MSYNNFLIPVKDFINLQVEKMYVEFLRPFESIENEIYTGDNL
jgi:hypothetical protein